MIHTTRLALTDSHADSYTNRQTATERDSQAVTKPQNKLKESDRQKAAKTEPQTTR